MEMFRFKPFCRLY